jgi:hypothetical protein
MSEEAKKVKELQKSEKSKKPIEEQLADATIEGQRGDVPVEEQLENAARNGKVEDLKKLITGGVNVDALDCVRKLSLHGVFPAYRDALLINRISGPR